MSYLYPIALFTSLEDFQISNNSKIRKITELELNFFFGITDRELDSELRMTSCSTQREGIFPLGDVTLSIINDINSIFNSNYVFETTDKGEVDLFNKTIKLLYPSESGLFLGFESSKSSINFHWPNPYIRSFRYAKIEDQDEWVRFNKVFEIIKQREGDRKLQLIFDLYLNCLSGGSQKLETRFTALVTILESLYTSESRNEIKFRLSIRIAYMLSKEKRFDRKSVFDLINKNKMGLYDIRSDIVHTGLSQYLDQKKFEEIVKIVSESILKFVYDKDAFSDDFLKQMILQ